jgi:hypothetical protein
MEHVELAAMDVLHMTPFMLTNSVWKGLCGEIVDWRL